MTSGAANLGPPFSAFGGLKMKRVLVSCVLASAALISSPALAQTSSAATTATTTIVQPVVIAKSSDLVFGTIIKPATGNSTVTLASSADTVSASGTGFAILGGTSRAKYTITGEGGQAVSISFPATFDMTGPSSSTLEVTLASDLGTSSTIGGALGAEGTKDLNLGGSFDVGDATTTGAYTGTFSVTVAYQ